MQIAKNAVVVIDYTLTDEQGAVLDSSEGRGPFAYIQGAGGVIPGLEAALEGKRAGETLAVTIAPADAYGEREESLRMSVPRERFDFDEELELGMRFQTQTENGVQVVTIVEIDNMTVTVDGNHPLAGVTLNFDIAIVDVRSATEEELQHGHVHGPGGHHH